MPFVHIIVILLVVGVVLWAVQAMPAIDPTMKQIVRVIVILLAVLWVLGLAFPGVIPWRVR
jgi:hypothetical protein